MCEEILWKMCEKFCERFVKIFCGINVPKIVAKFASRDLFGARSLVVELRFSRCLASKQEREHKHVQEEREKLYNEDDEFPSGKVMVPEDLH